MPPPAEAPPAVILLVGGGAEEPGGWSDAPYRAFAEGRRVAVLGTSESDEPGWYADYFRSLGALAADEYVLSSRADALSADLAGYDAFFLRGGDQWEYISLWGGTPVEDALRGAAAIGGTSAGAAVLGEVDYTAENGTVYPEEVLADWADPRVTLSRDFLPLIPGVITDTHFGERGRIGRLVPFAACEGVTGVGVDDATAAVLEDGAWTVYGTGTVSFVTGGYASCGRGPPVVHDVTLDMLVAGWTWRDGVATGPGADRRPPAYAAPSEDLALETGTEGTWTLLHARADDVYCGTLELSPGANRLPAIVTIDAWDEDVVEARVAGTLWAIARAELPVGILAPAGAAADAYAAGGFTAHGDANVMLFDARGGETSEEVGWRDPECAGPRLARALTGVQVHLMYAGAVYLPGYGAPPADTGDSDDTGGSPDDPDAPAHPGGDDAPNATAGCGCASPGADALPLASALAAAFLALSGRRRRGPARV